MRAIVLRILCALVVLYDRAPAAHRDICSSTAVGGGGGPRSGGGGVVERLATLLREALPPDEITHLKRQGARFTEDQGDIAGAPRLDQSNGSFRGAEGKAFNTKEHKKHEEHKGKTARCAPNCSSCSLYSCVVQICCAPAAHRGHICSSSAAGGGGEPRSGGGACARRPSGASLRSRHLPPRIRAGEEHNYKCTRPRRRPLATASTRFVTPSLRKINSA